MVGLSRKIFQQTPFDNFHVIPLGDLKKHAKSFDCWCNPGIRNEFAPFVVVHKSADKREYSEITNPYNIIPRA